MRRFTVLFLLVTLLAGNGPAQAQQPVEPVAVNFEVLWSSKTLVAIGIQNRSNSTIEMDHQWKFGSATFFGLPPKGHQSYRKFGPPPDFRPAFSEVGEILWVFPGESELIFIELSGVDARSPRDFQLLGSFVHLDSRKQFEVRVNLNFWNPDLPFHQSGPNDGFCRPRSRSMIKHDQVQVLRHKGWVNLKPSTCKQVSKNPGLYRLVPKEIGSGTLYEVEGYSWVPTTR